MNSVKINEDELRKEDIDLKEAIAEIMDSDDLEAKDVLDLRLGRFLREKVQTGLLGKTIKEIERE
jgi:hypothetical protein